MVQGKTIVIGSVIAAGGTIGAIALYLMMKGQMQMPSLGAGANVSYGTGGMTDQQACAAKSWVWEANQCKQPKTTNPDKLPDEPIDTPKVQCCTGGGMVSNPKYCPGGTAEPNCPQQEVACPSYYVVPSSAGAPERHAESSVGAGQPCPVRDAGFGGQWDGPKVYGGPSGPLPGSTMANVTVVLQRTPSLGHDLTTLDPGSCNLTNVSNSERGDMPKVKIHGPMCLRVEEERRTVKATCCPVGVSCGSYSVFKTNHHCIKPGESMDFRPQKSGSGYLYRKKIYRVNPSQCQCPSSEAPEV